MRIISCHRDLLEALAERERAQREPRAAASERETGDWDCSAGALGRAGTSFVTGLDELDGLPPRGAFASGAVHEVLSEPGHGLPRFFALLLARSAALGPGRKRTGGGAVVWSDPRREAYPPALAAGGLPLERVVLLRPRTAADEVWALAECLRCRGVAAVVAAPPALSRVQARRLQLAAERGGGVGVFLRAWGGGEDGTHCSHWAGALHYAAATRWLVAPAPGDRDVQRWRVQLVHGHGGQVGRGVVLEVSRGTPESGAISAISAIEAIGAAELVRFPPLGPIPSVRVQADPVRAIEMLAHRPPAAEKPKVPA